YKGLDQLEAISQKVNPLVKQLRAKGISVKYDDRDTQKPGFKFNEYELKGVPVRLAIGQRDLDNGTFEVARRDNLAKETVLAEDLISKIEFLMEDIQSNIFQRAFDFRNANITEVNSYDEFKDVLEKKGGFIAAYWDGTSETEERIKEETKATIRCIPLEAKSESGSCMVTGKPSARRVLFAKAY
ncbi:MAG: proline--tRNA ligase, partial [Flavobacteriales bacterium]